MQVNAFCYLVQILSLKKLCAALIADDSCPVRHGANRSFLRNGFAGNIRSCYNTRSG
jgi:hypothetical protein